MNGLVFDPRYPSFEILQEIIKVKILSNFCQDFIKMWPMNVNKSKDGQKKMIEAHY